MSDPFSNIDQEVILDKAKNLFYKYKSKFDKKKYLINSQSAGLEPARASPNRFQVYLLNHSDMIAKN